MFFASVHTQPKIRLTTLAAMLLGVFTLHAQLVNDGATNTLSNVTTNIIGDVTVGTNGAFTLLVLSDNSLLTNSVNGLIGRNSTAKSNEVRLINSTARWRMGGTLFVGSNGVANRLVVSNGALVGTSRVMIGNHPASSNNEVIVSGPGSTLNSPNGMLVGADGNANRLTILNDGKVFANVSGNLTTIGFNAGMTSNSALVADPGSRWSVNATLSVGSGGNGNTLVVSNGALVDSLHGTIGGALTASNNLAIVTGAGSTWTNSGTLRIGDIGPGNQMVVSNGGSVFAGGSAYVGLTPFFSANNRVTVDGGALRVTNSTASGLLDVRRGTNVLNSGTIDVDMLLLTNQAQGKFQFSGGTLITRGAAIQFDFIVGASGTSPAVWDVRAGATNHVMRELTVGDVSSFNQVRITNGGRLVASGNGVVVGRYAGARSNSLVISGAGSECYTAGFVVGEYDQGNSLLVSDGGRLVVTNYGSFVGHFGSNNLATVTGAGSLWSNVAVTVGTYGDGNRLVVSNSGGVVSLADLSVGYGGSGSDSRLLVSDGGTVTASNLFIGYFPLFSSNNLLVANGGAVLVTNAAGTGTLDVRHGTNRLDAGLITADLLLITNSSGEFEFNGGQLITRGTTNSNGRFFVVGNGTRDAILQLRGGTHVFTSDIIISSHGSLTGNGAIVGIVAVQSGGTLSPGASIGKLTVNVSPSLQGTTIMEISKNGSARTNDQVQAAGTFFYGGSLTVSNLGPTALALGDRFQLFIAPSYFGSFSSLTLPPLNSGLDWTNKLLVDGSVEVFAPPAIPLSSGTYTQSFDSLSMSGGVNLWRDNSTLLGWYAAQSNAPISITSYIPSDGSLNQGALYSFGSTGNSDRALGSIATVGTGDISYGMCLTNDTANSVSNFTITYTGEQWRNAGGSLNTLTFWYRVNPSALTNPEPGVVTNWTEVTNLNFVSPTKSTSAADPLDGNASTNRHVFSTVLIPGLVVPPGQTVFLRWDDTSDATHHGMAVDDLVVSFSALRPQITSVSLNPTNGFFQIYGLGESNVIYGLEIATNLTAPIFWLRIGSNTANGTGLFQFTDTNAPAFPMRFYRALSP